MARDGIVIGAAQVQTEFTGGYVLIDVSDGETASRLAAELTSGPLPFSLIVAKTK
jgi:preprotein translocase subunit SecD